MYQVFGKPKQKPNNPNAAPTDRTEQNRTNTDLQQEILILREKLDFERTLREHSEQQTAELKTMLARSESRIDELLKSVNELSC